MNTIISCRLLYTVKAVNILIQISNYFIKQLVNENTNLIGHLLLTWSYRWIKQRFDQYSAILLTQFISIILMTPSVS